MASKVTDRIELAKLCSSKEWSKAIRILDSLLAQTCVIQDIWSVTFFTVPSFSLFVYRFLDIYE